MHPLIAKELRRQRSAAAVLFLLGLAHTGPGVRKVRWNNGILECTISKWWWLCLGVRHLYVRQVVLRRVNQSIEIWSDPGLRGVWVK